MPLVSSVLQLGIAGSLQPKIKQILEQTKNGDNAITADQKALELSNAIAEVVAAQVDAYIKMATITVPAGIPVATAGSPAAQVGATTAPMIAIIS